MMRRFFRNERIIRFTKMQSLGQDLMVVDGVTQKVFLSEEQLRRLGHRHFGVGFERCVLLEPPFDPRTDFFYRIYNADGRELNELDWGVCCCLLRFITDHRLCPRGTVLVASTAGEQTLSYTDELKVRVQPDDGQLPRASSCERVFEGTLLL